MALTTRNNNRALMALGATQAANIVGQHLMGPVGQAAMREVAQWAVNKVKNRQKKGKNTDLVRHPGAMTGAIAAPVAVARIIRGSKPKFRRGKGSVTVTHRELIGQWNNSPGLVVNLGVTGNVYRLNPYNGTLFPWLQTLAANFDQYKFDNVQLQYVPLCSTTETGRVALYFDKDSQDAEPADRVELANMAHLTESSAWAECVLRIPTDGVKRFMNDNTTTDPKLVDLGQVGVATYGGAGTNPVGDIFIHYTVTFFEPQPSAGLVETEQTGTGSSNFGPNIATVTATTTTTSVAMRGPGTYLVVLNQRCSTLTSVVAAGNATISSLTNTTAPLSAFSSVVVVVVNEPGSGLLFTGTGFGNFTLNVVRARRANRADVI